MYPTPHSPFPDDKFITTRALTYSITDLIVPIIPLPPCPSITPASITFSTLVTSQSCQFDPTIYAKPLWKADQACAIIQLLIFFDLDIPVFGYVFDTFGAEGEQTFVADHVVSFVFGEVVGGVFKVTVCADVMRVRGFVFA